VVFSGAAPNTMVADKRRSLFQLMTSFDCDLVWMHVVLLRERCQRACQIFLGEA